MKIGISHIMECKEIFVEAVEPLHCNLIGQLADIIWREHYGSILHIGQIDYMLAKFQSKEAVWKQIMEDGYRYFLICLSDSTCNGIVETMVSSAVGYFGVKADAGKLFLSKFYILKESRGKGLGTASMHFIEKYAKTNGLSSIWLTVNRENLFTIGQYKHMGFSIVEEKVADIGNGYVMDDYVMEKIF